MRDEYLHTHTHSHTLTHTHDLFSLHFSRNINLHHRAIDYKCIYSAHCEPRVLLNIFASEPSTILRLF